jgi:transcriptional regulator with XRE-family HTH domain
MSVTPRKLGGRPPKALPDSITEDRRWFASLLQRVRREAGFTQSEFAEKLELSRGYLAQLERGEKPPQARILHLLETHPDTAYAYKTARKQTANREGLWSAAAQDPETAEAELLPELSMIAIRQAIRMMPWDAKFLDSKVDAAVRAYPTTPAADLLGQLILLQDLAHRLQGTGSEDVLNSLVKVHALLGKVSHDLGDHHAALVHLDVAAKAAAEADHPSLQASWVHSLESLVHYWANNPEGATRAATEAEKAAREAAGSAQGDPKSHATTMMAWALASKARAAALRQDLDPAEKVRLIEEVRLTLEAPLYQQSPRHEGLYSFPPEKQQYYLAEALALASTGSEKVLQYTRQAVAGYPGLGPEDSYSDWAGVRAAQAVALVKLGDIRGAARTLQPVLQTLNRPRRIRGIQASLRNVDKAVDGREFIGEDLALANALQNQIEDFIADAPAISPDPLTRAARALLDLPTK